nr:uncharacterized protein LOC112211675 [Halyomorpha halys]
MKIMEMMMLLLWTFHKISTYEITDLTNAPGITAIKMPPAYTVDKYHTFVHYINFTHLNEELTLAEQNLNSFKTSTFFDTVHRQLQFVKSKIESLLNKPSTNRKKRGLINGIGTAIKWVTGNMDASDKEHYDQIITKLERNSYHIEHNIEQEILYNKKLIETFRNDILILNKNNDRASKIINTLDMATISSHLNELYSIINYITLRTLDIENSLEFCELGILHSSMLTQTDISYLIKRNISLISTDLQTLWQISKTRCSIKNNVIHYFISIPLKTKMYSTMYLLPIPVSHKNTLVTTLTPNKLILLDKNTTLTGNCTYINTYYYCINLKEINDNCIQNLLKNNFKHCITSSIKVTSFIKYIDEVDYYLSFNTSYVTLENKATHPIFLPLTALIKLEQNETLLQCPKPNTIVIDSKIIKLENTIGKPLPLNMSFDVLDLPPNPYVMLETLDYISIVEHDYYFYILGIFVLYLFMYHIYILILNHCKCTSRSRSTPKVEDIILPHINNPLPNK